MKKWISLILIGTMAFSLTACGTQSKTEPPMVEETPIVETTPIPEKEPVIEQDVESVANVLYNDFVEKANNLNDALSIAKELVSNDIIAFSGDAVNVEPGLLTGFGDTEIKGFSDGAMFAPMIGTIPFVGYVFIVDGDTNPEEFRSILMDAADPRWNICTEAEEMLVEVEGDRVFFVMSPLNFDQESTEEMPISETIETETIVEE